VEFPLNESHFSTEKYEILIIFIKNDQEMIKNNQEMIKIIKK